MHVITYVPKSRALKTESYHKANHAVVGRITSCHYVKLSSWRLSVFSGRTFGWMRYLKQIYFWVLNFREWNVGYQLQKLQYVSCSLAHAKLPTQLFSGQYFAFIDCHKWPFFPAVVHTQGYIYTLSEIYECNNTLFPDETCWFQTTKYVCYFLPNDWNDCFQQIEATCLLWNISAWLFIKLDVTGLKRKWPL